MLAHHYLEALELTTATGGSTAAFSDAAAAALADAGDRTLALNANGAAVRFFRAALELLPRGDARPNRRSSARSRTARGSASGSRTSMCSPGALSACGRGAEAFAPLERHRQNPWARAAIAFGRGEPAAAAGVFAEMGAHASEACCRLSAARELIGQRRDADADVHLQSALGFYRQVGAAR